MFNTNNELRENAVKLSYRIINELFYFDNNEKKLRLVISTDIKKNAFRFVHNELNHFNYARTYERLTKNLYMYNMFIKFHKFIRYCFQC